MLKQQRFLIISVCFERKSYMVSFLSITILSCKTVSLICLLVSIYWYQWFRLDIRTGSETNFNWNRLSSPCSFFILVDRQLLEQLCMSYGAFCDTKDPMPLPRLIVVLPCILAFVSLLLETIDVSLLHFSDYHIRSIFNFFLGKNFSHWLTEYLCNVVI